jgi:hypothetical protein
MLHVVVTVMSLTSLFCVVAVAILVQFVVVCDLYVLSLVVTDLIVEKELLYF